MRERYIQGTQKKYSINENGEVFINYKYSNVGKKSYKRQKVSVYLNGKKSKSPGVNILKNGKTTNLTLPILMIEAFKIKPPDDNHRYITYYINGDMFDNSIKNIGFKVYVERKWKYDPLVFHKKRIVISKKCCDCGEIKLAKEFHLQENSNTYRNQCEKCRNDERWAYIKADDFRYKRVLANGRRWAKTEKGARYQKEYQSKWGGKSRDTLDNRYINNIINRRGLNPDSFDDSMKAALREIIKIKRLFKTSKT
jgi:hypothetical protein